MLTYKNHQKELVLPEYGRNIQQMADHCLTIEDRDERTRCARSIIDAMTILFPTQGDQQAYRRKLWDLLAIMTDFKLDVDVPFEFTDIRTVAAEGPQPVSKGTSDIRRRQYGHLVESLLDKVVSMPEGDERNELTMLLAIQMKKLLTSLNPEGVEDVKVFKDLYEMSNGAIALYGDEVVLPDFKMPAAPSKKKRKK